MRKFALKLQQFTGPMMAKSLEDTAFYRYHALLGAQRSRRRSDAAGACRPREFHDRMASAPQQSPHGLTATATHDTKRGEDARTRILALSELPELWAEHVAQWRELNAGLTGISGWTRSPSPRPRIHALSGADRRLAARSRSTTASRRGSRTTPSRPRARASSRRAGSIPNEDYERGLRGFIARDPRSRPGRSVSRVVRGFARRTALLGALNSLTQLVLKATMPGVPDFYQGTEIWDLSLVDPDNRRPVDFAARQAALAADAEPDWPALAANWPDGRIKLALTHRLLSLRNEMPALFRDGGYEPVEVTGPHRDHIVAFRRIGRTRSRGGCSGAAFRARYRQRQPLARSRTGRRSSISNGGIAKAFATRSAARSAAAWMSQACSPPFRSRCCGIDREPCAGRRPFLRQEDGHEKGSRREPGTRVRRNHIPPGGCAHRHHPRCRRIRRGQLLTRRHAPAATVRDHRLAVTT